MDWDIEKDTSHYTAPDNEYFCVYLQGELLAVVGSVGAGKVRICCSYEFYRSVNFLGLSRENTSNTFLQIAVQYCCAGSSRVACTTIPPAANLTIREM